jgi:hypothetical protein
MMVEEGPSGGDGDDDDGTTRRWEWTLLPRLPEGAQRWLGAAGVADGWLVIAAGANACGFEGGGGVEFGAGAASSSRHDPCSVPCTDAERCPPELPSYRLRLEGPRGFVSAWKPMARFPGGGLDVPNSATAGGSLYVFGGWRANGPGMAAWKELYGLDELVPIAEGTNGAQLLRTAYKYTPASDKWERLPDLPQHMCQGGTAVLEDRYIVQLGSAHGKNSFRVGSDNPAVTKSPLATAPRGVTVYADVPEFRLQQLGIATYYGDAVLAYDTVTSKYSRVGVLPLGLITSHCVTNTTHIVCALGEPRHGWNANCETAVQIGRVEWKKYV